MRISMILLLVGVMHLSASTYSQTKVSLNMKDVTVQEVFLNLEKMTNYTFLYKLDLVGKCGKVNVEVVDKDFSQLLKELLNPLGLSFTIDDQVVIVTRGKTKDEEKKEITIKGRVFMADSTSVPGATVILKGTSTGISTDMAGGFVITIPYMESPVLVFSFMGMRTREVRYVGQKEMLVLMEEDVKAMDEVIVTGYQKIKKKEMVGSSQTVKRDELFFDGTNSVEQMLQGKMSGMLVLNTSGMVGSRQKVRVRGTSTLLGNQEPVWVVDGIIQEDPLPFKTQELNAQGQISEDNFDMIRNFIGNAISWLSPNDIADITVLKDASATVLYGVKAANGVIVITTKKGEAGRLSISYSGGFSLAPRLNYRKLNLMNSKERIEVSRESYERGLIGERDLESVGYEGILKRYLNKEISYSQFDSEVKNLETINTDWFDILYRNPFSHNHSVNISGGADRLRYYASINATFNNGTAKGNDSESYSGSLNLDAELHKKVMVGMRLTGSYSNTNAFYQVDPFTYAMSTSRAIPCFQEDGSLLYYKQQNKEFLYNILNELSQTGNTNEKRDFNLNFNLTYDILSGLRFESVFGMGLSSSNGESYASERSFYITSEKREYEFGAYKPSDSKYLQSGLPHGGELNTTETRNTTYSWRNSLAYTNVIGLHNFGFTLGMEIRSNIYKGTNATTYGYFPDRGKTVTLPPVNVIINAGTPNQEIRRNGIYDKITTKITDQKANYLSYYASVYYSLDQRYVINASVRSDASNRFGQDTRNRFLPVWSLGVRWNVTDEHWMQGQNVLSQLFLKGSYGWQGNVAENFGPDLIANIPTQNIDNLTGEYLLAIKSLPYGDLRWEKTKTINLEAEMGFFENRFAAVLSYYRKTTEDMIVMKEVPYEYGIVSMPINGGNMKNQGWELSVSFTPVRLNDFVWTMSLNSSKNINKIESTMNENENWRSAVGGTLNKKGYAVSSFWAFDFIGLNPETGTPQYNIPSAEENPEGITDATAFMKYMGKLEPDFQGGVSMSFRYKTLTLSSSFNLNVGGKKFLYTVFNDDMRQYRPNAYSNLPKDLIKRWRKPGDEKFTDVPGLPNPTDCMVYLPSGIGGTSEYAYRLYNYSDVRVVNSSFLRCNSLSLTYTFPEKLIKSMNLNDLTLTGGVTNPFIIMSKKFKGMDPEVGAGSQPIIRNYSFSINISL